jgi:hypothetical protein
VPPLGLHVLRVLKNRLLRTAFEFTEEELTGGHGKLQNDIICRPAVSKTF